MSLITLTTDFATGSPYVAAMKGVILSINASATLVDLTHAVPPQDVRCAAIVLEDVAERFPAGTIHLIVVDPGVGTERAVVYARIGSQQYVAPDNGVLSRLVRRSPPAAIIRLENQHYWLPRVSSTFHGRDIFAPAAAHLSLGVDPSLLGPPQEKLVDLDWPPIRALENGVEGSVLWIDGFGNLVTDIRAEQMQSPTENCLCSIACNGKEIHGLVRAYGQRPVGTLVALFGSTDRLEIAVVGGSAARALGAAVGDRVTVRWQSD